MSITNTSDSYCFACQEPDQLLSRIFGGSAFAFDAEDPREKVLISQSVWDRRGALHPAHQLNLLKSLDRRYDINFQAVKNVDEICRHVRDWGKALKGFLFEGHGTPSSIQLSGNYTWDITTPVPPGCFDSLHPSTVIALFSCSTGSESLSPNFGEHLSKITGAKVFAPAVKVDPRLVLDASDEAQFAVQFLDPIPVDHRVSLPNPTHQICLPIIEESSARYCKDFSALCPPKSDYVDVTRTYSPGGTCPTDISPIQYIRTKEIPLSLYTDPFLSATRPFFSQMHCIRALFASLRVFREGLHILSPFLRRKNFERLANGLDVANLTASWIGESEKPTPSMERLYTFVCLSLLVLQKRNLLYAPAFAAETARLSSRALKTTGSWLEKRGDRIKKIGSAVKKLGEGLSSVASWAQVARVLCFAVQILLCFSSTRAESH